MKNPMKFENGKLVSNKNKIGLNPVIFEENAPKRYKKYLYEYDEDIANEINTYIPDFLPTANNGTFVCPCCNNGANGHKNQGLMPFKARGVDFNLYRCFSFCGKSFTTIKLFQYYYNNEHPLHPINYYEAYGKLGIELGLIRKAEHDLDVYIQRTGQKDIISNFERPEYDFIKDGFYQKAIDNNDYQYLLKRGISKETQIKFNIGLVDNWVSPTLLAKIEQGVSDKKPFPTKRCIIPRGTNCYLARAVDDNTSKEYQKMITGPAEIFNTQALFGENDEELIELRKKPLFCVEGEIDAMSIEEVGGKAIGLGSTSLKDKFVTLFKGLDKKDYSERDIILMLDNDKAGMKANFMLMNDLIEFGVNPERIYLCISKNNELKKIYEETGLIPKNVNFIEFNENFYKDANEWLIYDRNSLMDFVANYQLWIEYIQLDTVAITR